METGLLTLMIATFTLAVTHSINPDHWFPFVMVGRANKWKVTWVLLLAVVAGIGHVGTSVAIGLIGVFAEKGTSKDIAIFLESATPILLMVFGFSYAAYAFYKQRVGAHGHSHGIPIVNKWLGIDPHAYELPSEGRHHSHADEEVVGVRLGKVELYLHNMELHIAVGHADHDHHYDVTEDENHDHEHEHGEVTHSHEHQHHAGDVHNHAHESHDHGKHSHNHEEHAHEGHDHGHAHKKHEHGTQEADLKGKRAGWALVAIIGLTPCIALLPLTMASVKYGTMAIILVNISFAIATIGTIVVLTWLGLMGLSWIKLEFFEKNGDIITGLIIGFIGLAVKVFEL